MGNRRRDGTSPALLGQGRQGSLDEVVEAAHRLDAQQQLLWLSGTQEHCADGAGAANPIAGWTGTTTVGGAYVITMRSVTYCGVTSVEPATWGNIKSLYR